MRLSSVLLLCTLGLTAAPSLLAVTIHVPGSPDPAANGTALQNAVNSAQPGDTILVAPGYSYQGPITLPAKSNPGSRYITIESAAPASSLPAPNSRTGPAYSAFMPQILAENGLASIQTAISASYYKLVNLELLPAGPTAQIYQFLQLGAGDSTQTAMSQVANHITADRLYIHGFPNTNWKNGVQLNSASTNILNSYISDIHSDVQDSSGITGFNGPGPFNIVNNYIEASGVNLIFGGAVSAVPNLVPSNILIKNNDFAKNLAYKNWDKVDPATYAWYQANQPQYLANYFGRAIPNFIVHTLGAYTPGVKDMLELKTGQDVVVEGNTFTNCWVQADQDGVPIILTPRTEGGQMPWATVQRITFTSNVIHHSGGAVSIGDTDVGQTAPTTNNIFFYNMLFDDLRTDYSYDYERTITYVHIKNLRFDHMTYLSNYYWQFASDPTPAQQTVDFTWTNNIFVYGQGFSSDCGYNSSAFACSYAGVPPYVYSGNLMIGGSPQDVPAASVRGNFFPPDVPSVGFLNVNALGADYHNYALAPGGQFKGKGTRGSDPGFSPAQFDTVRNSK